LNELFIHEYCYTTAIYTNAAETSATKEDRRQRADSDTVGGFKYQLFSDVFRTVFQEVVSEKKVTFQDGLMSNFAFISGISGCFSRWTFRGGLNFEAVNTAILTHLGLRGKFLICYCFAVMAGNTAKNWHTHRTCTAAGHTTHAATHTPTPPPLPSPPPEQQHICRGGGLWEM
jgi:hypothetical protein